METLSTKHKVLRWFRRKTASIIVLGACFACLAGTILSITFNSWQTCHYQDTSKTLDIGMGLLRYHIGVAYLDRSVPAWSQDDWWSKSPPADSGIASGVYDRYKSVGALTFGLLFIPMVCCVLGAMLAFFSLIGLPKKYKTHRFLLPSVFLLVMFGLSLNAISIAWAIRKPSYSGGKGFDVLIHNSDEVVSCRPRYPFGWSFVGINVGALAVWIVALGSFTIPSAYYCLKRLSRENKAEFVMKRTTVTPPVKPSYTITNEYGSRRTFSG